MLHTYFSQTPKNIAIPFASAATGCAIKNDDNGTSYGLNASVSVAGSELINTLASEPHSSTASSSIARAESSWDEFVEMLAFITIEHALKPITVIGASHNAVLPGAKGPAIAKLDWNIPGMAWVDVGSA